MKLRWPNFELMMWAEQRIKAEPGVWTARLCRILNGMSQNQDGITHCGLCTHYANPRKRARADTGMNLLPGFTEGAYQLREPCKRLPLKKLQYLLGLLRDQCDLVTSGIERIPDPAQSRGWDWGTRWYPHE